MKRLPARLRAFLARIGRRPLPRLGLGALTFLVFLAAFADVLASDLPLVADHRGVTRVLAATWGGDAARAMRDDRAGVRSIVRAPLPYGSDGLGGAPGPALDSPSWAHPFGTDARGGDVLARMIHGTRTVLFLALGAVVAYVALGTLLGSVAGFFGGAVDAVVAQLLESVAAFPPLVLALAVAGASGTPSVRSLLLAIALARLPDLARTVRSEVVVASTRDYALAARALGASPTRVLTRHVAPNVAGPVLAAAALGVGSVVLLEASLDFLRVGVPAGTASWGRLLSEVREAPAAWWLLLFPTLAIFVTVASQQAVARAVRDALDPRGDAPPLA